MKFVVEFIGILLYLFCFVIIGKTFMGFQSTKRKCKWIILLLLAIVSALLWINTDIMGQLIIHLISVLIILALYFKEKLSTILISYIGIMSVLSMLSSMFDVTIETVSFLVNFSISEEIGKILSQILIVVYIAILGIYFHGRYRKGLKDIGIGYMILFAVILFADTGVVSMLGKYVMYELQTTKKNLLVVVYIGIVAGILVQLALLANTLLTRSIHIENEHLAKMFLEKQKEHYAYLEKRELETKKFRHDIRSHLFVLNSCIEKADYENAKVYLNDLNDKVEELGNKISVNNGIADAILNKYYDEAREKNVDIKITGRFPEECYISAYDICTVLSNLLSNAILAESQCGGNGIVFEIRYSEENEIYIIVKNDYSQQLEMENGVFKSSKEETVNHGFGLSNVKECVERNKGYMIIETENNCFKVMLSMKNEPKELRCK